MKDATILLDQMLDQVKNESDTEEAKKRAWALHGASLMAYRTKLIDGDTMDRYDEAAINNIAERRTRENQLSLLEDDF